VSEMPKFDFSQCEIATDEELEAELGKTAEHTGPKYFEPGKYDVVIEDVDFLGHAEKDPSWGKLSLTFKGVKDRTIRGMVLLPFSKIHYGAKKTTFPFKKFRSFCQAIGVTVTRDNIEQVLKQTFSKPEKLKGVQLSIEVGYEKGYIRYAGKNVEGDKQYKLYTQDGNVVCGSHNGQPLLFPDFPSAEAYAAENKIVIDKFPQVTGYSSIPNGGVKQADANW
jgi:hypothetical protein